MTGRAALYPRILYDPNNYFIFGGKFNILPTSIDKGTIKRSSYSTGEDVGFEGVRGLWRSGADAVGANIQITNRPSHYRDLMI